MPQEMAYGRGITGRRRLISWQQPGVRKRLHWLQLEKLHAADSIERKRAIVNGSPLKAALDGHNPAKILRVAENAETIPM